MRFASRLAAVCVAMVGAFVPKPAESCSCAGRPASPDAIRSARAVVFVGTVESIDKPPSMECTVVENTAGGAMGSCWSTNKPSTVTLSVARTLFGSAAGRVVFKEDSTCGYPFTLHEAYVVYAYGRTDGTLATSICSRTRLLAIATEDIKYFEGLRAGRAQAVVHGDVHRRALDQDGHPQLYMLRKPVDALEVFAMSQGVVYSTKTDPGGSFQIVLPPGSIQIWVERDGERVSTTDTLMLENGASRLHMLPVDLPDLPEPWARP
jgi:hypothetical protein